MRRHRPYLFVILFLFACTVAHATIFGSVRGIVHDPQHKPVADASVRLKSATSDWTQTAQSDLDGAFMFTTVPLGDYVVTVTKDGFADMQQTVTVVSNSSPILHFPLTIAAVNQTTVVMGHMEMANVDS